MRATAGLFSVSIRWAIVRVRTCLILGSRGVYHPWMEKGGGAEKPNEISADEY